MPLALWIRVIAVVIGSFVVVAAVLPMIRSEQWWIRTLDFPRLQVAILGVAAVAVMLIVWNPKSVWQGVMIALIIAAVVYEASWIVRYTPLVAVQVQDAREINHESTIRVMISNVLQDNREPQRFLDLVNDREPDVLLVLETDEWWVSQLAPLEQAYPHRVLQPQEDTYGMALYSRLPIVESKVHFLVEEHVPSIEAVLTLRNGTPVRFFGVHPPPPWPTFSDESSERDAELVIVGRMVKNAGPAIVAGDLNDVAWSHTSRLFQKTSELLDPRIGRGMFNSYNARSLIMRWPLDHIFHSEHFRLIKMQRLPHIGSDHFPVSVHLSLESDALAQQEGPDADAASEEEASEKIEKARENDDE